MKEKTLSERITERRKAIGLTQQQVATKIGKSHVTVYKWESGDVEPKGKNLFSLAQALQCSPAWLMFGDEEHTPSEPVAAISDLDPRKVKLLELFDSLPESEKEVVMEDLELKVEHFNKLYKELLAVRKAQSLKK
ncbi:helix-turn-helix domain-containing protein [Klebsiella quasivariicola]|uniref:helix-turn-helix domain-containing protein n=1 Tax=Klebsiella quasivariicola TaxID=2026240 RepID=UPI00247A0D6F|nr:helix-turn-helix domain-containing protein [Klebsiella quasivariicola]